jgi:hypothetical protein
MNRIMRSRLIFIAALLVVPIVFTACLNCETCVPVCEEECSGDGYFTAVCIARCFFSLCPSCYIEACEEYTKGALCEFFQFQLAAIEFCEGHPQECQEALDAWVE